MQRTIVDIKELTLKPFTVWENEWFLLTAGDYKENDFNTMTVAWGSIGSMWSKAFAQVVIRPSRHTLEFMEKYDKKAFQSLNAVKLKYDISEVICALVTERIVINENR